MPLEELVDVHLGHTVGPRKHRDSDIAVVCVERGGGVQRACFSSAAGLSIVADNDALGGPRQREELGYISISKTGGDR